MRESASALRTTWIARRAQGKDFFKYVDTVDGRNEVAMLQGREEGLAESLRAVKGEFQRIGKETQEILNSPLNNLIGFLPNAVLEMPFVRNTVLEQERRAGELKQRGSELRQTTQFLKGLSESQHQYRADYIKDQTGLQGKIDNFTSDAAPRAVKGKEGFVIFGMNGHSERGHAVALYHCRDGVRFFDPNLGEAYFEDPKNFRRFLSEFVRYYSDENRLGQLKGVEITDFEYPIMPKSPEDAELTDHGPPFAHRWRADSQGGGHLPVMDTLRPR